MSHIRVLAAAALSFIVTAQQIHMTLCLDGALFIRTRGGAGAGLQRQQASDHMCVSGTQRTSSLQAAPAILTQAA